MSFDQHTCPVILLLEDEAIIAIDLADELQAVGYAVAGPFTMCSEALAWLSVNTPSAAILDAALKDGVCSEIARELESRGVPFLIYSGHQDHATVLAEFAHVLWIEKPTPAAKIVSGCRTLMVA